MVRRWRGLLAWRYSIYAAHARKTWKRFKHALGTRWCAWKKVLSFWKSLWASPLLGLIGAVSGLVHVFSQLGLNSGASDTRQIALGISEALNATVFGLSIAVPTLIGFTYFSRKVEVMSVEMETLVVELINKCYYGRSSREFAPAKAAAASSMPISTPLA
jgi:hypothetical protein